MERREAPGRCATAPLWCPAFPPNTVAPCLNGACETPFGRACEAHPEAAAGDDLRACEALPPNRCASRRSTAAPNLKGAPLPLLFGRVMTAPGPAAKVTDHAIGLISGQ